MMRTTGRMQLPPPVPTMPAPPPGTHALPGLHGAQHVLVVPDVAAGTPLPLVVLLHGAGGEPAGMLPILPPHDAERGLLVLAPKSRRATWDVIAGGLGPDVEGIGHALAQVGARFRLDRSRMLLAGFSDGASYALTLGLMNGDLFGHLAAFSPGFVATGPARGRPSIFVSHGTGDTVLPIHRCSRRLVPALRAEGYEVDYREFEGGHIVPPEMVEASLEVLGRRAG